MRHVRPAILVVLCASCATLGGGAGGGEALPNAHAGPFRDVRSDELGASRSTPYGLDDGDLRVRDPAIVDDDGDPTTPSVIGFFSANAKKNAPKDEPPDAILRYEAPDGRSFNRAAEPVLVPDQIWEGDTVGAPAVLREGNELWVYYAAAGGIGLAKSSDGGHMFTKENSPVLNLATSGWDASTAPASPGVTRLPDGNFALFYTANGAIGEARSGDGKSWVRLGQVLTPRGLGAGDEAYDSARVGGPFPVVVGDVLRLYYGAENSAGVRVVGLAARTSDLDGFQRAVAPVYGTAKPLDPGEPCVLVFDTFTLLYAAERGGTSMISREKPAIAVGVAPATAELPPHVK
jgi:hypothetical protein